MSLSTKIKLSLLSLLLVLAAVKWLAAPEVCLSSWRGGAAVPEEELRAVSQEFLSLMQRENFSAIEQVSSVKAMESFMKVPIRKLNDFEIKRCWGNLPTGECSVSVNEGSYNIRLYLIQKAGQWRVANVQMAKE